MPAWLDTHLVSLLNGLAIGFLLFILAIGLSLIFGMMDVLNLAHGVIFLAGGYAAWAIAGQEASWLTFAGSLAAAGALGAAAGVLLAVGTERLATRSHVHQALLTLGVALIAADLLSALFGNDVHAVN